jgi:WD40 repeat protein
LWNREAAMQTFQRTVQGEWRGDIRFSPDGRWLAISSDSYVPFAGRLPVPFVLFDTTGQEPPKELPRVDAPFLFVRRGAAVVFRQDRWKRSRLGALDLATGKVREVSFGEGCLRGFAAGPDGKTFYISVSAETYTGPSEIRAYGATDLRFRATVGKTDEETLTLVGSADGRWVVAAFPKGALVWNVGDAKQAREPALRLTPKDGSGGALSADGGLFAMPGQYALRVWNTATGKPVFSSGKHKRAVCDVACCPMRPLIATGDSKGNVFFWDHTGNILARYDWKLKDVRSLAFAPDGLRCAAADTTGKVVVWDVDV